MNSKVSILLVDDEPDIIEVLEIVLQDEGMEVSKSSSAQAALELLRQREVDIVISDIRMPDMSGVELLKEAKQLAPDTVFVLMTAYASTETAIEALQHGAYDYLTKPFKMDELLAIVRRSLEKKSLKHEAAGLQSGMEAQQGQKLFQALHRSQLVGKSQKMLEVYRTIGTVAVGESTVLIMGESGTGKELVARAIHEASPQEGPPVRVDQLRRLSGDPAGKRAVRLHEGSLYRRERQQERTARNRRRRIDFPRRDRRYDARHAGQAPARSAGEETPAPGRHPRGAGRCARDRRHQPRPAGRNLPRDSSGRICFTGSP